MPSFTAASAPIATDRDRCATTRRVYTWMAALRVFLNDDVVQAWFSPDGTRVLTASRDKTARV